MTRAASSWPASAMRAARVSPDLSSAKVRVSDTVMIAMRTGTKAMLSSIPGIADDGGGRRRSGRCGRTRRGRQRRLCRRMIDRPAAGGGLVEAGRGVAHAAIVHPVIHEHALYVDAGLEDADALDEGQRIVFLAEACVLPARHAGGAGVVGGGHVDEIAAVLVEQIGEVALAERHVERRVVERCGGTGAAELHGGRWHELHQAACA